MKKVANLIRYLLIIYKLQGPHKYVPTHELIDFIDRELKTRGYDAGVTQRTLQRDINDIFELLNIEIANRNEKGYYIKDMYPSPYEQYEKLLLNFDLLNALNTDVDAPRYILAEHHRPLGSHQLPELTEAIRKQHPVSFQYTLVRHNDEVKQKKVLPYFLKESNQRWYLMAMEDNVLKSFGVDRISHLQVLQEETFQRAPDIDAESLFKDCYGIWNQFDLPVEDIELSYDALDGKFLKSVPLHHSQEVLCDTAEEFRIRVRLRITNDFVMELLSRSRSLTVIRPAHLRERVRKVYEEALKRNS